MAVIVIKDLSESVDLDRAAMSAIVGGARTSSSGRLGPQRRTALARLIQYPAGFPGNPAAGTAPTGRARKGR